ncbi:hypothetical protein [Nocardia caishijiensis]|uniref:Uncharacterized protein n=1 Tax=Nocardia caishijiensis TaxID=184756 RepID=A0ABQ6YJG5_9NOCA|nr:hypothetical protein [Nocardia caishijiensis]KAF0845644.1 hypothetical protein FNL39_10629 [Nocardia caishijiensis]
MYIEQFSAAGQLTDQAVEELMTVATSRTPAITLTVGARTVQLPVLPVCWPELAVGAGTPVTVETTDPNALREFVTTFQRVTAARD